MKDSATPQLLGRHNQRVARLRRQIQREEPDVTVVDGLKLIADVAGAGVPIVELFTVGERLDALREVTALARVLDAGRAHLLDPGTMTNLAPTRQTQGVLAVVTVPAPRIRPGGIVLYLDRLQDPGNVGGVIRCAAAFGAAGVTCSPGCADPFSPRALRASSGQALVLPVQAEVAFAPLAAGFRSAGGEVVGTVEVGGTPLRAWHARTPLLLVLGNEGQGLSAEVSGGCDRHVTVPLDDAVDSLNVAVTAGVILASLAGVAGTPILEGQEKRGRPR